MKSTVFFIFFLLILSVPTFCQNNSIKVYTSYGIGHPDTRLGFINPFLASHLRENGHKYTPDDEYSFGLEYNLKIKKNLSIGIDIGYARLVQDFLLPADGNGFLKHKLTLYFGVINQFIVSSNFVQK